MSSKPKELLSKISLIYQTMSSNFDNIAKSINHTAMFYDSTPKSITYVTTNVPYAGEGEVQQRLNAREDAIRLHAQVPVFSYNGCHNLTALISNLPDNGTVLVIDSINLFTSNLWLGQNSQPNETIQPLLYEQVTLLCDMIKNRKTPTVLLTNAVDMGFDFKTHDIKQYSDLITYTNTTLTKQLEEAGLTNYLSSHNIYKSH